MNNSSDISNIHIKANHKDTTIFFYNIKYINNYAFEILLNITLGNEVELQFFNKYGLEKIDFLFKNKQNKDLITTPFKLVKEDCDAINKIPKIIHQSYTSSMLPRLLNATYTWQLMNNNYKYMYWNDDNCDEYIYTLCNEKIKDAYFSLYSRAYKSDIFRLCVLYEYGGFWTDISSECEYSLDNLLNRDINLVIVKDNPSQVTNGNIYQAFIAVEKNNEIIKYILDLTVDRVLNFSDYDKMYPWIHNETIAVTGPTIFAIALNNYLKRPGKSFFKDEFIEFNSNKILLLDHFPGFIFYNDLKIVTTKYENFQKDRTTPHYSKLFSEGYILKKKIPIKNIEDIKESSINFFQIWISKDKYGGNFLTDKMHNSFTTWITKNPEINYIFVNEEIIIKLIKNETKFPNLLKAYNSVSVFAFKADLIRYYLLYKYGGYYADIDSYCVNSLSDLIKDVDVVLSYDCEKTSISQGFIYSKNPGVKLFEELINQSILNILSKNITDGDTGITGPKLFGKVARNLFNYLEKGSEFQINGLNVKIITYCLNLPVPEGSWLKSSFKSSITSNMLTTYCKSKSGKMYKNKLYFLPGDILSNNDGRIIGNTSVTFSFSDGSGFYIYNNKIYGVSKYAEYNEERHVLGGNDFAIMFKKNKIFTDSF